MRPRMIDMFRDVKKKDHLYESYFVRFAAVSQTMVIDAADSRERICYHSDRDRCEGLE
ncbi:hypothetical protein Pan258_27700 [Symmachiella dynata]|nr:hypothetical protein Pan258_27700 [Symmachiella dynata]